jgi:hypothetical protein
LAVVKIPIPILQDISKMDVYDIIPVNRLSLLTEVERVLGTTFREMLRAITLLEEKLMRL